MGVTIARGAALKDIGDKHLVTIQPNGLQHGIQQQPGAAYKGFALTILIRTGRLADDHQISILITHTEHSLGAGLMQATGMTCFYAALQCFPVQTGNITPFLQALHPVHAGLFSWCRHLFVRHRLLN